MISIQKLYPSGAHRVYALVRDTISHEVFTYSELYMGYTKSEMRKSFIATLSAEHLVLVND